MRAQLQHVCSDVLLCAHAVSSGRTRRPVSEVMRGVEQLSAHQGAAAPTAVSKMRGWPGGVCWVARDMDLEAH